MIRILTFLSCCLFFVVSASATTGTMLGLADDSEVQRTLGDPPYAVMGQTTPSLISGSAGAIGKERCPVFVFKLPDLGAVSNPLTSAAFSFEYISKNGNPVGKINVYGLGRRTSPQVLTDDFWAGTTGEDPTDSTLLQTAIITTNSTAYGVKSVTSPSLLTYLNAQYAVGAGAGQYVFIRLSTDAAQTVSSARYNVTAADGGIEVPVDTRPRISFTADDGPMPPEENHIIASDHFDSYFNGALAGQGSSGYGWSEGWAPGAASSLNASSSSNLIYQVPINGALVGGGRSVDITGSGTGLPVSRRLSIPQTETFYLGFLLKVWGNPNTEDIYTLGLGNSASDTSKGFNCGIRGLASGGQTHYFIRKGTGTPPSGPLLSASGNTTDPRYLVLRVQKTSTGNFNKVTGWVNPGIDAETTRPNGDMQLNADLGTDAISHVLVRASSIDSDDRLTVDALALSSTFSALMGNTGPGPDGRVAVANIQIELAPDGSSNAPISTQSLTLGQTVTCYAIARSADGTFISNIPVAWKLRGISGAVLERDLVASPDGRSAVFTANGAGTSRIYPIANSISQGPSGLITVSQSTISNPIGRPFIWSRMSERDTVLARVRTHGWATAQFLLLQHRANAAVASHSADRSSYLRRLPLTTSTGVPRFSQTVTPANDGDLITLYDQAVDCAVMYHLTGMLEYARCAADTLHNAVLAYRGVTPLSGTTAGWIYSSGLLGEASDSGKQLPLVYDFLYHFLKSTPSVFQLQTTGGSETPYTNVQISEAQQVFRTFYQLTRDRGQANNNWSPNMAQTLVPCVLALDDSAERTESLKDYLTRDNARQTSLKTDATRYPNQGDIWPESLDYSSAVNTIHPYLMTMVDRYDPSLNLFQAYANVPFSMARPFQLIYPHGHQIHFGDFHHDDDPQPWLEYEIVYGHAKARNLPGLRELYGPLLNAGVSGLKYNRSAQIVNNALPLLWFTDEVVESAQAAELPRTDTLSHAGIALQRNLSPTNSANDALMCFVGGGAHVHSHANGMNMELYGQGEVLGAEGGRGDYGSPIHEDYYRVFAAHNTIIVNGASRGEGGWVGVGINKVEVVDMEPKAFQSAVSPNLSFTCSSFADDKGTLAEATQQRTLAVVRTSPTTGYYVDLYRSRSTVTNRSVTTLAGDVTDQYHDYIYHNLGDSLTVESNGASLPLFSQPARFQNDIGDSYQQPGWRYFSNTVVSQPYPEAVLARYNYGGIYMDVHLPAVAPREYAKADAPGIIIPPQEGTKPAPVLAVRQIGDAWDKPFAVVFEPHRGGATSGSIQSVTPMLRGNVVVGLEVRSLVSGIAITQYVISNPNGNETYQDMERAINFTGRFAVITVKAGTLSELYLGEGSTLVYAGHSITSLTGNTQASVVFAPGQLPQVTANASVQVAIPSLIPPAFANLVRGSNGVVSLTGTAALYTPYTLWTSPTLNNNSWSKLSSGTVNESPFTILDTGATAQPKRFYRFSTP